MALVDAFRAARADEDVFVVTGHADHFMRNNLADGQNQIMLARPDETGQLRLPGEIHRTPGRLPHELRRHFADGDDARTPVVHPEQRWRHAGIHFGNLPRRHRRVRAQRGQHVRQTRPVIIVDELC